MPKDEDQLTLKARLGPFTLSDASTGTSEPLTGDAITRVLLEQGLPEHKIQRLLVAAERLRDKQMRENG